PAQREPARLLRDVLHPAGQRGPGRLRLRLLGSVGRGGGVPGRGQSWGRSHPHVDGTGPAVVDVAGSGPEGRSDWGMRWCSGTRANSGHVLSGGGRVRRLGHGASIWASWDTGGRDDRATGTVAWGRRGPTVACPRHSVGRPAMLQGDGPTSPRPAATNHNLERNRLNPDALNDI